MILNLPSYEIVKTEEKEHDIIINLKPKETASNCKYCDSLNFRKRGKKHQFYFDLPIGDKRVGFQIEIQTYLCRDCNKSFQNNLKQMHDKHNMTNRLVSYVKEKSLQKPFTHIAEDTGLSEGNVRKIFKSHTEELSKKYIFETPKVMGIDEIHLAKRARVVITNIEEKTIIEIFKNRNKTTITAYLKGLSDPYIVLNVAMDMWWLYKDAVNDVLPDAIVVIDKFHVLKMANKALEKCRKEVKSSLSQKQIVDLKNDRFLLLKRKCDLTEKELFLISYWENNYPVLVKMYKLKEEFFEIYEASSKEEAYQRYSDFEVELTDEVKYYWADITRAVGNWYNEIFSYFDYPVTNAYAESINSVIRHVDRMGRSYSFETIRAKMLYAESTHKRKKPRINKQFLGKGMPEFEKNYGVDMIKLVKLIENGDLSFES